MFGEVLFIIAKPESTCCSKCEKIKENVLYPVCGILSRNKNANYRYTHNLEESPENYVLWKNQSQKAGYCIIPFTYHSLSDEVTVAVRRKYVWLSMDNRKNPCGDQCSVS